MASRHSSRAGWIKEALRSLFLAIGGAALLATGAWFASENARFLENAERAEGIVVRLVTQRVRASTLYRPVVRFRSRDRDEPVEFTAKPGLWPSPFEVGDRVEVAYHERDPVDARVVSFWMLWLLPLVAATFGGCCMFAGWHNHRRRGSAIRRAGSGPHDPPHA